MTVEGDEILMERDGAWEEFEIRGVNMGVGIPGEWATDYAIDHDTYMRWFEYIQELAQILCVYTPYRPTTSITPSTTTTLPA